MAIQFMRTGQQGVMIWNNESGYKIGIDIFLSDEPKRLLKNVVETDDFADVSLLFGTHDHLDHIDREAWKEIGHKFENIKFVAPKYFENDLPEDLGLDPERFIFMDEGEKYSEGEISIEAIPAAHEFLDVSENGLHPYLIYILTFNGKKICHMGDTCLYEGIYGKLREKGPFDIIFPPINGRDAKRLKTNTIGNMTFQEAADLVGSLRPGLAVPGHYDMFAHNGADPYDFKEYIEVKYPQQNVEILEVGKTAEI